MTTKIDFDKLRSMIARCEWTFAKTMPQCPHEYIVRGKCPLSDEEFVFFVNMQREHGVEERWGEYNFPYLYIDDYKYWTMGALLENTTVINRAKACVVNDVHQLYEEMNKEGESVWDINKYLCEHLGLKENDFGFNIELINGRLKEIEDCVKYLENLKNYFYLEFFFEWRNRLRTDFSNHNIEYYNLGNIIYTGITIPYKDIPDAIAIRIQMEKRSLYYGLTYMPAMKEKRAELQEAMSFINSDGDFIKGSDWLYYKYTTFKGGYEELKGLIEKLLIK